MFVKEHKIPIDYSFYITNQIMKPVLQVFGLVLEKIWLLQGKTAKIKQFRQEVAMMKKNNPVEKWDDKLETMRNKELEELLFREFLRETQNAKTGNQAITGFFKAK